eukprot:795587-Prymnesium_polylepis.1
MRRGCCAACAPCYPGGSTRSNRRSTAGCLRIFTAWPMADGGARGRYRALRGSAGLWHEIRVDERTNR